MCVDLEDQSQREVKTLVSVCGSQTERGQNSKPESRQRSSSEDVVKNDNAHPMKMSCEEELYM